MCADTYLTLSLTHACNLSCPYCYAGRKHATHMSPQVIDAAITFGVSQAKEILQLGFFGGEPLLRYDDMVRATGQASIKAEAAGITLKKTVTTNATLITDNMADWVTEKDFFIGVSLDGNKAAHDATRPLVDGHSSYQQTLQGMNKLVERKARFEVISVLSPDNVDYLSDSIAELVENHNVTRISVNPDFSAQWTPEKLDKWADQFAQAASYYMERYRQHKPFYLNFMNSKIITRLKDGYAKSDRCGFGCHEIAVAPSGRIFPCERLIGNDDEDDKMVIGNVFDGFYAKRRAVLLATRGNVDAQCADCAFKTRCMNWCGCVNFVQTGQINRTGELLCHHERIAIELADKVAGQLFAEKNRPFLTNFYDM